MDKNWWNFPYGKDLDEEGHNNSSVEHFLDDIGTSLTREIIQNSLDASNGQNNPVKVSFSQFSISTKEIPNRDRLVEFALPLAKEKWENNHDTNQYLEELEETITSNKDIQVLKISDYNTTGLNEDSYLSLVTGNSYSSKAEVDSAGSKGIGKAAPFAASDLRMVFYNSINEEVGIRSAGVFNFVSFPVCDNKEENYISQARATYKPKDQKKKYIDHQITFGTQERSDDEHGTDVYIIALKDLGDWESLIIEAVLNNFLLSIYDQQLEVEIYGKIINSSNLEEVIESVDAENLIGNKSDFEATKNYYELLTSKNTHKVLLPDNIVKNSDYTFVESETDGYLLVLDFDNANRKVLQTRTSGMKIYERGYISSVINFSGIFQATGKKLSEFLKNLENTNHTIWKPTRARDVSSEIAEDFLADLGRWFREEVATKYEVETKEEIDAFGVGDLLPLDADGLDGEIRKDSGINNIFANEAEIKPKKAREATTDGDKEGEDEAARLREIGLGEGEETGSGSARTGGSGGGKPGNQEGAGEPGGTRGFDDEGTPVIAVTKVQISTRKLKAKIIETYSPEGKYKFIGIPMANFKKVIINFKSVGDSGSAYSLKIVNAQSNTNEVSYEGNDLIIDNVRGNEKIEINFQVNVGYRVKMEVVQYEVKS